MRRRSWITVGCTVMVGMAVTQPLLMGLRGNSGIANGDEGERTLRDKVIAVADTLQLHWVGDGPQDRPQCKLILSEMPIRAERQARLNIHQPAFAAWHGTVAVYVGQPRMVQLNCDPEHPERVALWCGSFVYGDPALIERLRSCEP